MATFERIDTILRAIRRGGSSDGNDYPLVANESKELIVAQGLPPYTEMTRLGEGWTVQTSTLFAPLVAVPSTTAALELWNNTNSGVDLILDTVFADQILSTAATQTYAIYAMVTVPKAVPTLTALALNSMSGKAVLTSSVGAKVVTGVGTTVIANGWRPWGIAQAWGTAAATPGNAWHAEVNGRLIAPPGCSICLHVVGSLATASTFQVGASFYLADVSAQL